MKVRGEFLKKAPIVAGMELALFRNDEEDFAIFQIEILAKDRIFTLAQHQCDEKMALKEYDKILKELKSIVKKS
ncbi:MAG: hypothetical protein WC475_02705 [Candidatus Paceibacterota bacterium]